MHVPVSFICAPMAMSSIIICALHRHTHLTYETLCSRPRWCGRWEKRIWRNTRHSPFSTIQSDPTLDGLTNTSEWRCGFRYQHVCAIPPHYKQHGMFSYYSHIISVQFRHYKRHCDHLSLYRLFKRFRKTLRKFHRCFTWENEDDFGLLVADTTTTDTDIIDAFESEGFCF